MNKRAQALDLGDQSWNILPRVGDEFLIGERPAGEVEVFASGLDEV
ncbi:MULTISPECIES: hypothetical protein [unclassified Bradyrhizobium]|nr:MULTISPECIES: hypothetical protein [unclassified Bradyrhizobium]MCJ9703981.1 hypothetical protein [Bradyrhizobium sp. SHOUNA76]MCJ9733710.1 hypothetical protein [Bradyrhizobium sp. PRIMUS42]